jgi:hypothetical protein
MFTVVIIGDDAEFADTVLKYLQRSGQAHPETRRMR